MKNVVLKDDFLQVEISLTGAALEDLHGLNKQTKFICNNSETGLPTILFPTLTAIKDGYILKDGESYQLMHGGFAKLQKFQLKEQGSDYVVLELNDNEETRKVFPYSFCLQVKYELFGDTLFVSTKIKNTGNERLPFMLGYHPAYSCPDGADMVLSCEEPLNASRYIRKDLMVTGIDKNFMYGFSEFSLTPEFFENGTIAMTDLSTKVFSLRDKKTGQSVTVNASEYQNVAIFAPSDKPLKFVSIECWDGSPDWADTDHVWEHKRDMTILEAGESISKEFSIVCKENDDNGNL